MTGEIAPDVQDGTDPDSVPISPIGQQCVDTADYPEGALSLWWEAYRDPRDADPTKDYYRLRVYGTFGGETGSGVRWMAVRARLLGEPTSNVFEVWPDGSYDGACMRVPEPNALNVLREVSICGRTVGRTDSMDWSHTVTWTCVGCLIADHADREIGLYERVAVAPGQVPSWEIYADLGS